MKKITETLEMKKMIAKLTHEHVENFFNDTVNKSVKEEIETTLNNFIKKEILPVIHSLVINSLNEEKVKLLEEIKQRIKSKEFLKETMNRIFRE